MRQRQRRDSAQEWIRSGAAVTVKSYAKRYGVDRYTAHDDLTALGFALPDSAQQWAQRPPATPRRTVERDVDQVEDEWWIMLDGRCFLGAQVGAPYQPVLTAETRPEPQRSSSRWPARTRPRRRLDSWAGCGTELAARRG
jgi:hypothetical protein